MDKNNVDLLKKVKIRDGVYAYFYKSNVKNKKYKVVIEKDGKKVKMLNFGDS